MIIVTLISLQAYYSLFASFRSYLLHTRRLVLCGLVILLYCLCVFIQTQHSKRAVFYHIAVALIDNEGQLEIGRQWLLWNSGVKKIPLWLLGLLKSGSLFSRWCRWQDRAVNRETVCRAYIIWILDYSEKCVLSFSASDSENEGDRVGDHLAGRRLSQQVIKVFHKTLILCNLGDVLWLLHNGTVLSSSRKDKEEKNVSLCHEWAHILLEKELQYFRVFIWLLKVIGFALLHHTICLKNLSHFFIQSDVKQLTLTRLHMFSRALRQPWLAHCSLLLLLLTKATSLFSV